MKREFAIVLVTAPNLKTARQLARAVLEARLAACVNLVRKIESHYWWEGRIQHGTEVLLIVKSSKQRLAALERRILSLHPYDTPEFVVLQLSQGNERYLKWLAGCLRSNTTRPHG